MCKGAETKELACQLRGVEGKPGVGGEAHAIWTLLLEQGKVSELFKEKGGKSI